MSNELLEEVREDVRREELIAFWQKYWQWIVGTLAAVFLITVGYSLWTKHQENKRNELAFHYEKALNYLNQDQTDQALAELNILVMKGDKSYLLLSLLKQAGVKLQDDDVLKKIIDNKTIEESFRQLANLILIEREMNASNYASAVQKLIPLVNSNAPWRASAQELLAVSLMQIGSQQQALQAFQALSEDQAAPYDIRLRAAAFVEFIRNN